MSNAKHPVLNALGLAELAGRRWRVQYSFWSVLTLGFFLFGDQQLIAPNLSRIGAAFGFIDPVEYRWYIGSLPNLLFLLVGGALSIPIGFLSDIYDRRKLLLLCIVLGEASCLFSGLATNYYVFLTLRTLTGIGLGGFFPILYSMVGDFFRSANRATGAGWLEFSMGLGMGAGQILGGFVANEEFLGMAGWRWSFVVMAAPSFLIVTLHLLIGKMPKRGSADRAEDVTELQESDASESDFVNRRLSFGDFKHIFANRTNFLVILQGIPGTIPWGFMLVLAVDFLEKSRGYPVEEATILATIFGGASIIGGLLGGFLGKWFYLKNRRWQPAFAGIAVILGAFPCFFLINYPTPNMALMSAVMFIGGIIVNLAGPNSRAILINVNLPENRGAVFSVFNLTDKMGQAGSPALVGLLLFVMRDVVAYNLAIASWFLCGLVWFVMMGTVARDEDRVRSLMQEQEKPQP